MCIDMYQVKLVIFLYLSPIEKNDTGIKYSFSHPKMLMNF